MLRELLSYNIIEALTWFKTNEFKEVCQIAKGTDWTSVEVLQDGLPASISDKVPESVKIFSMNRLRREIMAA